MIYITFERGGPKCSNTTARALAWRTAVQQRQLRAKWLICSTRFFFAFVSSLKLSRRLLCSVRFVFVSTFNLQRGRAFVVGITSLSKEAVCVKAKAPAESIFLNLITCGRNSKRTIVGYSSLNSRVLHHFTFYLFCIDKILRACIRAQITMLLAHLFQILLDSKHGWMAKFCGLVKTWVDRGFGLRDLGLSQSVGEDDFWYIALYHWIRSSWLFKGSFCSYMYGTETKAILDCHRFLESGEKGTTILCL